MPALKKDVWPIYVRNLKAIDTTERDRALAALEREKEHRRRVELEYHKLQLQVDRVHVAFLFERKRKQFRFMFDFSVTDWFSSLILKSMLFCRHFHKCSMAGLLETSPRKPRLANRVVMC